MPDSYTKTLQLKVALDENELQRIDREFKDMQFLDVFTDEDKKEIEETFKNVRKNEEAITLLEQQQSLYRKAGNAEMVKSIEAEIDALEKENKLLQNGLGDENGEANGNYIKSLISEVTESLRTTFSDTLESFPDELSNKIKESFSSMMTNISSKIKGFFDDIVSSVKEQLTTLSQLMGISTTSVDIDTQKTMYQYGLSAQDYYAITSAMNDLGLSGSISDLIDDMFYMSEDQTNRLLEKIDYYAETYNTVDAELLENYNEWQETWQDFKQGMTDTLMKFVSDNRDVLKTLFDILIEACGTIFNFVADIMPFVNGLMTAVNGILKAVEWLIGGSTSSETASSDILASRTTYNASSNTDNTITINNTFNGNDNATSYQNYSQDAANQIIKALEV